MHRAIEVEITKDLQCLGAMRSRNITCAAVRRFILLLSASPDIAACAHISQVRMRQLRLKIVDVVTIEGGECMVALLVGAKYKPPARSRNVRKLALEKLAQALRHRRGFRIDRPRLARL